MQQIFFVAIKLSIRNADESVRNTWCHRRPQNLREYIECEYEIEFEESHTTSCPNKYN